MNLFLFFNFNFKNMEFTTLTSDFCERKILETEYLNSFSSLYLFYLGFYSILKNKNLHSNTIFIYQCIVMNGIYSFLYHWTSFYGFKMFDELTMIIPIWFGILKLLEIIFHKNRNKYLSYSVLVNIININFIVMNIFPFFHPFFPIIFGVECLSIIFFCYYLKNSLDYTYNYHYSRQGIFICLLSGVIWIVSEIFCHKYLILGHSIWHIGMPYGFHLIFKYIDPIFNKF